MFKMWELGIGIYLLFGAVWDVIKREIPVVYLLAGSVLGIVYHVFYAEHAWYIGMGGALIGSIFLLVSKFTEEQIGYGDSWMLLNLGIYLGIWKFLVLLGIVFGSSFIFSCIGLIFKKLTKNTRIPFFPFLLIGYIGAVIW